MRKAINDALNDVVRDLTDLPGGTAPEISLHVMTLVSVISNMESSLRDCVNELCLKCGQYRTQHLGSCDGCRWKRVKEEVRR